MAFECHGISLNVARAARDGQLTAAFRWLLSASAHVRQATAPPGVSMISLLRLAGGNEHNPHCVGGFGYPRQSTQVVNLLAFALLGITPRSLHTILFWIILTSSECFPFLMQSTILWLRPHEDVQHHPKRYRRSGVSQEDQSQCQPPHQETVSRQPGRETGLWQERHHRHKKT